MGQNEMSLGIRILWELNPDGTPGRKVVADEFYNNFELREGETTDRFNLEMQKLLDRGIVRAADHIQTTDGSFVPNTLELTSIGMQLRGDKPSRNENK